MKLCKRHLLFYQREQVSDFLDQKKLCFSQKPVIAVCGVRTGVGKSPLSIKIMEILKKKKCKIAAVRHPMPYGNLSKDLVQKYEKLSDFKKYNATIEEQEEYYNYVKRGFVIYAGVDYSAILKKIEKEADIILIFFLLFYCRIIF